MTDAFAIVCFVAAALALVFAGGMGLTIIRDRKQREAADAVAPAAPVIRPAPAPSSSGAERQPEPLPMRAERQPEPLPRRPERRPEPHRSKVQPISLAPEQDHEPAADEGDGDFSSTTPAMSSAFSRPSAQSRLPVDVAVLSVRIFARGQLHPDDQHILLAPREPATAPDRPTIGDDVAQAASAALAGQVVGPIWAAVPQPGVTGIAAVPATLPDAIQAGADACHGLIVGYPINMLGAVAGLPQAPLTVVHAIGMNLPLPGDDGVAHVKLAIQVTGIVAGLTFGMPVMVKEALLSMLHAQLTSAVTTEIDHVLHPEEQTVLRRRRTTPPPLAATPVDPRTPTGRLEAQPLEREDPDTGVDDGPADLSF